MRGSQDVGDDLGRQPGKIEQRVTQAGFRKVDQPYKIARADQDVFKVQVAMNDGLRTGDGLIQPLFQLLKRGLAGQTGQNPDNIPPGVFSGWQ